MHDLSIIVNIVNILSWIVIHFVLPAIKNSCINIDAFIYEPFDKDVSRGRYLCCTYFGP